MTTEIEISASLRNCLERCALGPSAQFGPRSDGMSFVILASMLEKRGLVRTVKHRNHTRTYALTAAGRACLARVKQDQLNEVPHG